MSNMLYCLGMLLLCAIFEPIVCPTSEMISSRRGRSSYSDTSPYISDNFNNDMDNKTHEHRSRKLQQQHSQQRNTSPLGAKISKTITDIFYVGPEKFKLFNTTLNPHLTPIDHMQADDSFMDTSSNQEQAFKVQRTPDGKLNLVFNDSLFLQKTTEATKQRPPSTGPVIFPNDENPFTPPKCAEVNNGKSFCTKVKNYPDLSQLKEGLAKYEVFFGEDLAEPQNITQRMNTEPDEEVLCQSVQRIIYPEYAMNKDSSWLLIVNKENDYKQGVRIEECSEAGKKCNFLDSIPNGYTASCKQNYIYRSLVALTPAGKVTKDHFRMPSCCQCVLKRS